jgi:hypothetical protein
MQFEQPNATAFIDRLKGRERSAQNVAVGRAEVDTIAGVLVELFSKNGLNIEQTTSDEAVTLVITYPHA